MRGTSRTNVVLRQQTWERAGRKRNDVIIAAEDQGTRDTYRENDAQIGQRETQKPRVDGSSAAMAPGGYSIDQRELPAKACRKVETTPRIIRGEWSNSGG
ncbi:hypothetical protein Bbelb_337700 [Branchiostoma belcheri]|nr:hypothetical protein Bbelb_337700 [Branchiostoma belcheri]